jgi:hypothetical protein
MVWAELSVRVPASDQATASEAQVESVSPERKNYWLVVPR